MTDFEGELVRLLQDFTSKVAVVVQQHALQSATAALGGAGPAPGAGRRRGPRKASTKQRPLPDAAPTAEEPFDADAAGPQVVSFLLANPGLRMDELGVRLRIPTSGLKPLVKKLVAQRMLRAEGKTRGRRYFPSRKATAVPAARPAKRRPKGKSTSKRSRRGKAR